ncbi:MAG: MoxR family ATPase [Chitinophagaceae bacterium]|nr:MoxR family ATPase [Chitinophagaceae bacterium]
MDELNKPEQLAALLEEARYVADPEMLTSLFLLLKLRKPLLLEGPPGVGKTESALVLSTILDVPLIRLQCYEGLDISSAVYEWNYQRQLLSIRMQESSQMTTEEKEHKIFGEDYLLKRPLLQAITQVDKSPVLLIDELDRSDEEFEAFLLELLSAFQITIPELGTVRATHKPYVILTSNRTRELSDALKRRCLYHWIGYPGLEKEMSIVKKRLPGIDDGLLEAVVRQVQQFRQQKLSKVPGISETIDWTESLVALGHRSLNRKAVEDTLGAILKSSEDIELARQQMTESVPSTP